MSACNLSELITHCQDIRVLPTGAKRMLAELLILLCVLSHVDAIAGDNSSSVIIVGRMNRSTLARENRDLADPITLEVAEGHSILVTTSQVFDQVPFVFALAARNGQLREQLESTKELLKAAESANDTSKAESLQREISALEVRITRIKDEVKSREKITVVLIGSLRTDGFRWLAEGTIHPWRDELADRFPDVGDACIEGRIVPAAGTSAGEIARLELPNSSSAIVLRGDPGRIPGGLQGLVRAIGNFQFGFVGPGTLTVTKVESVTTSQTDKAGSQQ